MEPTGDCHVCISNADAKILNDKIHQIKMNLDRVEAGLQRNTKMLHEFWEAFNQLATVWFALTMGSYVLGWVFSHVKIGLA